MNWRESVELALEQLGGRAVLSKLYEEVETVRIGNGDSVPRSLQAIVRKELEYNSSDSDQWQEKRDLFFSVSGIGNGVWGSRKKLALPPPAVDLDIDNGVGNPTRQEVVVNRIIRDTIMSRKIKVLHNFKCQICGGTVQLGEGVQYAEAHHIIPLGKPHSGTDLPQNIIVVCPNHHAMLDFGAIPIDIEAVRSVQGHEISPKAVDYHNTTIFASRDGEVS